jgi:hypothetical protein
MKPTPRVLSFTPALPGWRAVYWERDTGELVFDDLAGWAVVETEYHFGKNTEVEPCAMDGAYVMTLSEVANCLGVLGPSNDKLDYYRIEARRRFEAQKAEASKPTSRRPPAQKENAE